MTRNRGPIKAVRFPQGTRVTVKRGRLPMDPDLEGRSGMVVETLANRAHRYGVQLDGEDGLRVLREDELQAEASPARLEEAGSAGPGVGPGKSRI